MFTFCVFVLFRYGTARDLTFHRRRQRQMWLRDRKYLLVGKSADSTNTYFGHVEIYSEEEELKVRRKIGSETVLGSARIESANRGGAKVLRVKFENSGTSYEKTCLIHGDLDNYARISCYVYLSEGKTAEPGLEVLFVDRPASK